jgi:hypothetical protein
MLKSFPRSFAIGIGALSVLLSGFPALAQTTGSSIAISPLTFEITANPGDVITNTVRIFNGSSDPVTVLIHVEDFAPTGETGQAVIEKAESTNYSIATWTSVDEQEKVIDPGIAGLVNFTIRVPLNAEPGGHYGAITAEVRGAAPGGGGSAIAQKVAALLLLSVAGDVQENLELVDFRGPSGPVLNAGAITLTSRFENKGTVHLKPRGFVTITDMFGKEVAQVALDQRNVLPGTKRVIETTWQPQGFTIGRMRAQLTAIYGSKNEPLAASVEFWVIPMNVVGPVLVTVGILLVLGILLRKRLALAFSVLVRGTRPNA